MSDIIIDRPELDSLGNYEYGWSDGNDAGAFAKRGISEQVVKDISGLKNEPEWMLDMRLKGYQYFLKKPMPAWGSDLSGIDFDNIKYFVRSTEKQAQSWEDLPEEIKATYEKLGIPEAKNSKSKAFCFWTPTLPCASTLRCLRNTLEL
jgi:Fe-S cluster assembly protein SufB